MNHPSAQGVGVLPMVPVRLVIFDLDETLLDQRGAVTDAVTRWLSGRGIEPDDELVGAWFAAQERHLPAWRAGEISWREQRRRRLRDFLPLVGLTVDDGGQLDRTFAGYLTHYEAAWRKFDDVDGALERIRRTDVRTAVLTNGTVEQQNAKITAVGLTDRVGPVFTAEELGAAKPDPSTYLTVCRRLGVPADSALHVGDLHDLDVIAPRAAGLQAVHLDRRDNGPHHEKHRITSLAELPDHLAALAVGPPSTD
ncbi:MAG TPA: HAD family hydrolase [Mycobacteriales bacterium]